jgi:beta-phosphoglucomutase-like phosphatase (HAD superfamily)
MSACAGCGTEDKLYEKELCARCSLRRRTTMLLSGGTGNVPATMAPVLEAICAARNPRSALNWLRKGAAAAILSDVAAGRTAAAHEALDEHPRPRAAGFLRQMLTAGGVLPPRDEELTRAEQWLAGLLESLDIPEHRRIVRAFATWQVMRRLRQRTQARPRHRTPTATARNSISEAARFLAWLSERETTLRQCRQADTDAWLATASASASESTRGFLDWAARRGYCPAFAFPARQRHAGPAVSDSQRWEHATRLLRDDSIEPADRAAGCLVLLYGQNVTRIAALTVSQVIRRDGEVHIRLGKHDVPVPPALGTILGTLITDGKPHTGTGTPEHGKWLFPGLLPGQPITPQRLSARLNAIGIPVRAARRAALTGLAAQVPAAVLSDALGIHPTTAANWTHDAGSDWNRYAAELARNRNHEPGE